MEASEFFQYLLGIVAQGPVGFDLSTLVIGALVAMACKGRSFGLFVLAIGLVLVLGGHLAVHITLPSTPPS